LNNIFLHYPLLKIQSASAHSARPGFFYRRAASFCRFLVGRFVVFVVSSFVVSSLYCLLAFWGRLAVVGDKRELLDAILDQGGC
jgi:hypothetical protein